MGVVDLTEEQKETFACTAAQGKRRSGFANMEIRLDLDRDLILGTQGIPGRRMRVSPLSTPVAGTK